MRVAVVSPCSTIELLPPDVDQSQIVEEGPRFSAWVAGGVRLTWGCASVASAHNQAASKMAGTHVCGDCVLQLPLASDTRDEVALKTVTTLVFPPKLSKQPAAPLQLNLWTGLPSEILAAVVEAAGYGSDTVRAMSHVCSKWREGLAQEKSMFSKLQCQCVRLQRRGLNSPRALPWTLRHAVHAGNTRVTVAVARFMEGVCDSVEASMYWQRAARKGHPEAQWHIGFAHYKGLHGHALDVEEAALQLNRAAKQLMEMLDCPEHGALPPLMNVAACSETLANASHILGYMYLDGEGVVADTGEAVKWLKVAHKYGCKEASRVLGGLFRNGQY